MSRDISPGCPETTHRRPLYAQPLLRQGLRPFWHQFAGGDDPPNGLDPQSSSERAASAAPTDRPVPQRLTYRVAVGTRRLNLGGRVAAAFALGAITVAGCTSDAAPTRPTVTPESAYIAIVEWELEQTEPVLDEEGNIELPVVYLASAIGGTIDVGVQAAVVSAMDEVAVIRFADDQGEARDEGLEGEPVKDDGVMIVLNAFETDQSVVEARITRYQSATDETAWTLEVTAVGAAAEVTSAASTDPQPN